MNFQSWRIWVGVAGISGAVAVGLGAYGSHKLVGNDALHDTFSTAVQYHMWHTLALFGVSWLAANRTDRAAYWAVRAGWSFVGGIFLFSGSLYSYCLMTNHVHLLLTPKEINGVSRLMQSLGRYYVRYVNQVYGRTGTLWEGRFKSSVVDSENMMVKTASNSALFFSI